MATALSALPPSVSITAVQGDTVPFILDSVVDALGNTISSLSGWTVFFTVKRTRFEADADAVISKTSPTDITISGERATWSITAAQTAALTLARAYIYDVQLKDPDGRIHTVLSGTLTLSEQATIRTS